ncbi:hypothetical protein ACFQ0B_06080 [Nonomuraea thailandensis]
MPGTLPPPTSRSGPRRSASPSAAPRNRSPPSGPQRGRLPARPCSAPHNPRRTTPGAQPPGAQPPGAQAPGANPASGPGQAFAESGAPEEPAAAPTGSAPSPRARRRRTALIAAGAIVASLLVTAGQTYDGYLFYEKVTDERKETKETVVPAGQAGKVHNIEYRAAVSTTEIPQGSTPRPNTTWLKIEITRKLLDEANATMTAGPSEMQLRDSAGRTWAVEARPVGDQPSERLVVGEEYRIEGLAIVPTPVANEVQLSFRPSAYRSDTPTEDLFDRKAMEKAEKDDVVLVFRRR